MIGGAAVGIAFIQVGTVPEFYDPVCACLRGRGGVMP